MIMTGEQPSTRRGNCPYVTLWVSTWTGTEFYNDFHRDRIANNWLPYLTAPLLW